MKVHADPNVGRPDGERKEQIEPLGRRNFWDGRAHDFSAYAASTEYPEAFIRIMRLRKNW